MRYAKSAPGRHKTIGTLLLTGIAACLLAGCQTDSGPTDPFTELAAYHARNQGPPAAADQASDRPKSRAQIAMDCWALAEKTRASATLDAKGDFVNKCIDEKMNPSNAKAAPSATKPKAAAKPKTDAGAKPAS
ncbi:MAG: hypothetical protein JSR61_21535 [Proteobacteria bacterium]|nr:hypothetical protein [Pseudomonadota bacterium]